MSLFQPLTESVSLDIAAPPERVWELVSDVTRIGEFSPETFEARWARGSTGPEIGACFAGHVKRNRVGPTYWSSGRVTVREPMRAFEFSVGTDSITLNNWGYRLEPTESGTCVTEYYRLESRLLVRVYWLLLGPLRWRTNRRGVRTTLERMRGVLES